FLCCAADPHDLHSFPTRRSSDLDKAGLAEAIAAVRATRSMDELDGWLPAHASAHLRSGAEMTARFRRYPGAISNGLRIAADCALDRKSTRLNSSHVKISYAVFCL